MAQAVIHRAEGDIGVEYAQDAADIFALGIPFEQRLGEFVHISAEGCGVQGVRPLRGGYLKENFILEGDVAEGEFALGAAARQQFGDVLLEPEIQSEPDENSRCKAEKRIEKPFMPFEEAV